jgi:ABC-2 type transport system permease protein
MIKLSLRKTWAIAVREFGSFFVSPIVYGYLTGFLFLLGYFTVGMIVNQGQAELSMSLILFIFMIFAPLLTMRLITEERSNGTIELVFTSPVRSVEFVLGKYLAVLGVYGVTLLFTLEFPLFLMAVGTANGGPDLLMLATQYFGLILVGAAFLAVGLFCSALTENQIVAAISAFSVLLFLWVIAILKGMVPFYVKPVIEAFNLAGRIQNFQNGMLKLTDLVFFLSLSVSFLYATILYINSRSWRQ